MLRQASRSVLTGHSAYIDFPVSLSHAVSAVWGAAALGLSTPTDGSYSCYATARSCQQLRSQSTTSKRKADVAIVGAGHNGLVAALLLAKQGLKASLKRSSAALKLPMLPGGLV